MIDIPDSLADLHTALITWFERSKADLPWRNTRDPYAIWLSEIMLQQTQVATVIAYYERFLARFPTVGDLAAAPLDDVLKLWEGLGYYSRARSLKAAAGQIVRRYGGEIPRSREELLSLPGVGPYTAGAIAAFAFGLPEPAVDGNVMRVVSRLVACDRNVPDPAYKRDVEAWLRGVIPPDDVPTLMEMGAAAVFLPGTVIAEAAAGLLEKLTAQLGH